MSPGCMKLIGAKNKKSLSEKNTTSSDRTLYREGDSVDVKLLIYPGPRQFQTVGEVVECLSPTYYRVAYVDHKGLLQTKRFLRSQLP